MEKKLSASGLNEVLEHLAKIAGSIDELETFLNDNRLPDNELSKKDEDIVNGVIDRLVGFLEKCRLGNKV